MSRLSSQTQIKTFGFAFASLPKALGLATALALSLATAGCNLNSIGRPCVNSVDAGVGGPQISSPALECPSRLCLIQPPNASSGMSGGTDGGARATCTAECKSDKDCGPETLKYCASNFVCAVAVTTGSFACKKVCVCSDDLIVGNNKDPNDGGVITPCSCNPPKEENPNCG